MGLSEYPLQTHNAELTFIGKYEAVVHMCDGPEIPFEERSVLTVSQPVTGDSPSVVSAYAERLMEKHLGLHKAAKTEPCTPKVDPVSAIFKNRTGRFVRVDIDYVACSEQWRHILPPRPNL